MTRGETSFDATYSHLLDRLTEPEGPTTFWRSRTSRGLDHRECKNIPAMLKFKPDRARDWCVPTIKKRGVDYGFATVERLSYLSGEGHRPNRLADYVPNYLSFVTDELIDRGAYGPRMSRQWKRLYHQLKEDPQTRRGMVNVYNLYDDQRGDVDDVPCTLNLQFMGAPNDHLDMVVYMRSNDVWWGLTYDAGAFAFLLDVVSTWLGLNTGNYHHVATSLHLYERDVDDARDVVRAHKHWTPEERPLAHPPKGGWDLSYEDTWPALDRFWRLESRVRLNGHEPTDDELEALGSRYLKWAISGLSEYWTRNDDKRHQGRRDVG